jgi:hypothetical protein
MVCWWDSNFFLSLDQSSSSFNKFSMLGFYILSNEILFKVDRLGVKFEGQSVRPGKVEVKVIENKSKKSTEKRSIRRSCGNRLKTK